MMRTNRAYPTNSDRQIQNSSRSDWASTNVPFAWKISASIWIKSISAPLRGGLGQVRPDVLIVMRAQVSTRNGAVRCSLDGETVGERNAETLPLTDGRLGYAESTREFRRRTDN
jgi:hypothetical protein